MTKTAHPVNETAQKIITNVDDEGRSGSSLMAPLRLEEALDDVLRFMQGSIIVDGVDVPRYGVLSLLLMGTPCYVYGHPALKKLSKTAFTDGMHIFICDDFFDKLDKDAADSKYQHMGIEPLMLHELMHKLFDHVTRLRDFPHNIANAATDLSINAKLSLGFPEMTWVKTLSETGLSFRAGDQERYAQLSEDTIARELFNDAIRKQVNQANQSNKGDKGNQSPGGPSEEGAGQPGGKQPGKQPGQQSGSGGKGKASSGGKRQGDPSNASGSGDEEGDEPSDDFSADGDNHLVDLPTLIKVLEENGLEKVKESLQLPDSDDLEAIGRLEEGNAIRKAEAVQRAEVMRQRMGDKFPGAHIVDSASEHIRAKSKAKISWKLGLRELLLGDGQKWRASMEEPADLYYVDEVSQTLGTDLYLSTELAHKNDEVVVCMLDTSGSVPNEEISIYLAEIFELKMASGINTDAASEVIVLSADTVLRGEPIEINEQNAEELLHKGITVQGRGGTDFLEPCRQLAKLRMFKEKKIRALVYFTDLYAVAPKSLADMGLPEGTNVLFVVAPSDSNNAAHIETFSKQVEGFARVVEVREGAEADLSDSFKDQDVSPSRRRSKP